MPSTIEHLSAELRQKGIRPSYQRIRVLECLHCKDSHPTVDEIFQTLAPEIPSLSKATIYNTLHSFLEAGLIRSISIDETELRYDLTLHNHGHFKCASCGMVYNFAVDIDGTAVDGLNGFKVSEKNVYFKGLCPTCLT